MEGPVKIFATVLNRIVLLSLFLFLIVCGFLDTVRLAQLKLEFGHKLPIVCLTYTIGDKNLRAKNGEHY